MNFRSWLTCGAASVVLSASGAPSHAQTVPRSPDSVSERDAQVVTASGTTFRAKDLVVARGRVGFVDAGSARRVEYPLTDVRKILVLRRSFARAAIEGAALGGGVALGSTFRRDYPEDLDKTQFVLGFSAGGAALGALFEALFSPRRWTPLALGSLESGEPTRDALRLDPIAAPHRGGVLIGLALRHR
jgi:hypothetical protein